METMAERAAPQGPETYQLVDDINGVYQARQQERLAAEALLEARRNDYIETGELTYQPVDALSTAHNVLANKLAYGEDSEQFSESYDGLLLDCQRLVGEWYRKKRPEYFAPTRHIFNEFKEEFFSHGLSIRQMTENALTPIAGDTEEEARRVNERVEDATPHILRRLGAVAIGEQAIRTISQCTDGAIEAYRSDMANGRKHQGYNGYVPEIQKPMIRDIVLDPNSNDRFEEQLALDGRYFPPEIFEIALAERGVNVSGMDKTALHGAQMLVNDDLIAFAEHMDTVGTREWCLESVNQRLFMGEVVSIDHPRDYAGFRKEALERQAELKGWAETVAIFVLDLANDDFDRKKAPSHVEEFVKDILLNLAKEDITIAEQMFDSGTVERIKATVCLENQGRYAEADLKWEETRTEAPGGGFCGAGSCGLEGVIVDSKEDKALREELGASSDDKLVKDKERACKCGEKTIVYAYNKGKVIKGCTTCKRKETTYTTGKAA